MGGCITFDQFAEPARSIGVAGRIELGSEAGTVEFGRET